MAVVQQHEQFVDAAMRDAMDEDMTPGQACQPCAHELAQVLSIQVVLLNGLGCTLLMPPDLKTQQVKEEVALRFQIPLEEQRIVAGLTELTDVDLPFHYLCPGSAVLTVIRVDSLAKKVRSAGFWEGRALLEEALRPRVAEHTTERVDEFVEYLLNCDPEELLEALFSDALFEDAVGKVRRVMRIRESFGVWR